MVPCMLHAEFEHKNFTSLSIFIIVVLLDAIIVLGIAVLSLFGITYIISYLS